MSDFRDLLEADMRAERRLPRRELLVLAVVAVLVIWRLSWQATCAFC